MSSLANSKQCVFIYFLEKLRECRDYRDKMILEANENACNTNMKSLLLKRNDNKPRFDMSAEMFV